MMCLTEHFHLPCNENECIFTFDDLWLHIEEWELKEGLFDNDDIQKWIILDEWHEC